MSWEGASDPDGLGVSGYSYLFDETSDTLPDTSEDQAHTGGVRSTSSTSLSDSAHYFHLRTCDLDGNCTETVHVGPYNIDLTAPATATDVTSTTHTIGVASTSAVITMTWTSAVDNSPWPSGVAGYSYTFDSSDVGICGSVADLADDATTISSDPLANGDYYFHLCTVDAVGNWSDAAVVGPYVVDASDPPTVVAVSSVAAAAGEELTDGAQMIEVITQLLLTFSEQLDETTATDTASYQLVAPGSDGELDTTACGGAQDDDELLNIDEAVYDDVAAEAAVRVNSPWSLPEDQYRFFACATIEDLTGDPLDGDGDGSGGDDYAIDFEVVYVSNLLANPNLDIDDAGWTSSGLSYDASVDVGGAATSGSAAGNIVGPGVIADISECVDFTGLSGGRFDSQAWVRLTQNETGTPTTWVIVAFFDEADCAGTETGLAATSLAGDTGGAWQQVSLKGVTLPDGTLSVDAHFVAIADSDPDSDVDVGFDLLTLRYPATLILVDGFESGDTSAWSDTVGK